MTNACFIMINKVLLMKRDSGLWWITCQPKKYFYLIEFFSFENQT